MSLRQALVQNIEDFDIDKMLCVCYHICCCVYVKNEEFDKLVNNETVIQPNTILSAIIEVLVEPRPP